MLENWEVLENLVGVGCKIVNVVLNIFFGYLIIVVDIYLFWLGNWIGIVLGKMLLDVEKVMEWVVL